MSKAKEKPPVIGTCPCPEAGCAEVLEVRKYQERSGRGSMFKGKFYASCPAHGRVIDAARPASQEHVLERGTIWGATALAPETAREPLTCEQTRQEPAQPARAEPPPQPREPAPNRAVVPREPERPARNPWAGWDLWNWWPTRDS